MPIDLGREPVTIVGDALHPPTLPHKPRVVVCLRDNAHQRVEENGFSGLSIMGASVDFASGPSDRWPASGQAQAHDQIDA